MTDNTLKPEAEMNRGFLQILVLMVLEESMYGYMMVKHLKILGYGIEESTLYPLLRRLEKNDLIKSEWNVTDDRPKKFYKISLQGKQVRRRLLQIRQHQNQIIQKISKEIDND